MREKLKIAALSAGALATLLVVVPAARAAVTIQTLSNRADLISGGDALVAIDGASDGLKVTLDGRDVTPAFDHGAGSRREGLVDGLELGENDLVARDGDGEGARLTITNHPLGGPVFSGPQIQPWYCLPGALDAQCDRPTTYAWYYQSSDNASCVVAQQSKAPCFLPYDPANPPSSVPTTTTDQGKTVPYIVRVETGNMDRNQYLIAVLADPDKPFTRWTGPPAWNHKVYVTHGGGCGMSHTEQAAPVVLADLPLSTGYAVMSTALENNQANCNPVVQAESVMMAKEHLIESYGDVRYLMGMGGSGGSMAQLWMANSYPGLYDGIISGATFPDVPANEVLDCVALLRYWQNPLSWSPGVVWTEPQEAAAAGLASTSVCDAWTIPPPTKYAVVFDPTVGSSCDVDTHEPAKVYNPSTNPGGLRCSWQDYLINIFGQRPPDRWGANEKAIGHGFAGRPYDNVGVQYGLRALLAGKITPAQFVDLNAKVGAPSIDYTEQPDRVAADPDALATAYRSSVLNETNNLGGVPIIDIPGFVPGDNYEIHDIYKSWSMRQRLDAFDGGHGNHVIWYGPNSSGQENHDQSGPEALTTMDAWLKAMAADKRDMSLAAKAAADKPAGVQDRCDLPDRNTCDALLGPTGTNSRYGAGDATLRNDIIKCQLKPLRRTDYYPILFSDAQWDQLRATFPSGVCDYNRPGVDQQGGVPWQTYAGGPGGRPLGPPPTSKPL